ncbi:MAG: site-specific DNA-methyltransferase [Hyphomicrobiales bacterium]|nr:site-specific DNA-methyltransferase [Hyphomicrobiales bacterium]MDE2016926.1 site-specific DNA-methyltransferase [Hyphomicrobiales bacterium]
MLSDLTAFAAFDRATAEFADEGIPYFINEFWTARQRQSHNLHEISYRACFKAELPRFFIERLTEPGEAVYDPFMGRGTTPLEAALLGRVGLGNDVNPLSAMLARSRLNPPVLTDVARRLVEIDWRARVGDADRELEVFYHRDTLIELVALKRWLLDREWKGALDPVDDWIRMVALNRLTGHSSGFFSVYTMPPNQAVGLESQRKINAKRNQAPERRDVRAIILKKSRNLLSDGAPPGRLPHRVTTAPAHDNRAIGAAAVSLVVTSPPFLDIVDYRGDNWLRCWFAGIDTEAIVIDRHRKAEDWEAFVRRTFVDLARVVRPGGHVAFEVGEVRNGSVLLERHVVRAVAGLPFRLLGVMVNDQRFTKTANCWGVANNARGVNTNRIVILSRS